MSSVYTNFFNPQTVSLLLCLHELQRMAENREIDMKSELVTFLLNKILTITDANKITTTNEQFEAQLLSLTNNVQFLGKYQKIIERIDSFNNFYGELSNILKSLRSMRNSKLEQSNLVDFFVRRLYIYFEKLDFKEIVKIYESFIDYKQGIQRPLKQHEFMLTKSIQELKFNIENYSFTQTPQHLSKLIDKLALDDHTFKTSYLKGLMHAQQGTPVQSAHYLHKYFDKNLSNLFQDRATEGINGNKINHCILSGAYAGLQLGHLDQCLQAISQGLRISQNNSDQESINNCIIYLYYVAERLGKFREQILLAEHAITHSLNQNNLTLTLYSCLNCSLFEKKYDCADPSLSLLKTREVSWKDALHFAKKKLHSHYENNCRNIFHLYRSLFIPSFIHKLAILAQIPCLKNMLINPFYNRKQLLQLTIYKQFQGQNRLSNHLKKSNLYSKMCFDLLLHSSLQNLNKEQPTCSPHERIKIKYLKNEITFRAGAFTACYNDAEQLLKYCKNQGYSKFEYINTMLLVAQILTANELVYDALIQIEEALRLALQYGIKELKYYAEIFKAGVLIKIGQFASPIETLKEIENKGVLNSLELPHLRKFYEVKLLLNQKIFRIVSQSYEKQTIQKNILDCYQNIVKLCIQENELVFCQKWLHKMNNFVSKHPVFMSKASVVESAEQFCKKMIETFRKCEHQSANDQLICQKGIVKLRRIFDVVIENKQ